MLPSTQKITTIALVLLITGAIDNIRNLPATALFGTSLIFFFVLSAIVFLIPVALVSAHLTSNCTEKNGIFHWVKLAFGEKFAFLAIWLQWINTMVWFPTILSFIAGTLTYFIDPNLAQNKFYLMTVILGVFWILTLLNLKGIHVSATFASVCTVIGMIIPMFLIIALATIWVSLGKPLQIHFTLSNILPSFSHTENWLSLTAIMAAFLGIELAAVHVKDIHQPQKTFPWALGISVILILFTMILGSLAIALVLPNNQINLVNGVMQAFSNLFAAYHIQWFIPIITLMILIGTLGGIISWVISPARGLLQAAQFGFLPAFLTKENKNGVASNLLITQGLLVSAICFAFLLMPSVNGFYWLLTALSTQLYILMYVLLFFAAINLEKKLPAKKNVFTIPGGKVGVWITCLLGLIGCAITFFVGFIPPDGINVGNTTHYEIIFCSGMVAMILPVLLFYFYKRCAVKTDSQIPNFFHSQESQT